MADLPIDLTPDPFRAPVRRRAARRRRWIRPAAWAAALIVGGAAGGFVGRELSQARLQARFFSWLAHESRYEAAPGPSPSVRFPAEGPHDERLGYTRLPAFLARLAAAGGTVESQARWSPRMQQLHGYGLYPVYHEKASAGLRVLDRHGTPLYESTFPGRTWSEFAALPPGLVESLLYIENRELLKPGSRLHNPAVEWPRLAYAMSQVVVKKVQPDVNVPGASTLATQLEKYRHAESGLTRSAADKLRQMASASVRAYLDGPDTSGARRRIVRDYINTLPLGAAPGHGEVNGVGDGLWAWFGARHDDVTDLLKDASKVQPDDPRLAEKGQAYKRIVALLIGQRRPYELFVQNRDALRSHVDAHLRIMPPEIASPALVGAALAASFDFADEGRRKPEASIADRKGADAVRVPLLNALGVEDFYTLDRLDLTAHSTIDADAQAAVSEALRALADPQVAKKAGLVGPYLLSEGDPGKVQYSFTLFERDGDRNVLRVHTDTSPGPFSLNDGMKLELGSTAKLRTLVTWLELIAEIHGRLIDEAPSALRRMRVDPEDRLQRFVLERLVNHPGETLQETLEAAMDIRYSADPDEHFVTGGGVHEFHNFKSEDDDETPTVRAAFARSVNLPFVRMMRDVVTHLVLRGEPGPLFADRDHPERRRLLERFADQEGRVYLERFFGRYHGLSPDAALDRLLAQTRAGDERLTVVFRTLEPEASPEALAAFLEARLGAPIGADRLATLYDRHAPGKFDLQDRGYIAGLHPLEMVTVAWLRRHPEGRRGDLMRETLAERVEVYRWLMHPSRKVQQDRRLRAMLEQAAFVEIHRRWQRLGYPFERLVPSLATSLGSSGDRPTALAELAGILLNDGVRRGAARLDRLDFAERTPYETVVRPGTSTGTQVLPAEVARVARSAMRDVVERGTGSRLSGVFDEWNLHVGGKTGTGDNRREVFDAEGHPAGEEVRNRTGTLVFYLGDRWFGALTAHVPGAVAAEYRFTSALPSQVLKHIAPKLRPVFEPRPRVVAAH